MQKKIFLIFIILSVLLFSNCFEQVITISDNYRGIITYKVRYNPDFDNLIKYLYEKHGIELNTSIIFDKNKSEDIIRKNNKLKILEYINKVINKEKYSELSIIFEDINNIPLDFPNSYFTNKSYEENKIIFYNTTIALSRLYNNKDIRALYRALKDDEKKIADSYLKILKLKFIYKTDKTILQNNLGNISQDRKEVIYESTIYNELNNKIDTEIIISFRK